VWVLPCPDPRGLWARSVAGPSRVGGWVHVRIQGGLGPFVFGPKRVGFGSFRVRTQYGLGWRMGLKLKGFGFGFGSFPVRTPNGLGWGRYPDLRELGDGCISGPKGVWVLPSPDPKWFWV
jgi:hypothetical protein